MQPWLRACRVGILALLGIVAAADLVHAGAVLDRMRSTGNMLVAIDPDWPPISWRDDKGQWQGFDVDVANELGRRMGFTVVFTTPTWDEVTAGGWDGKWDLSVGSMTPTKLRGERLAFPAIYYVNPISLAVYRDNRWANVPGDLSGKRIGVLSASVYQKYLTREDFGILGMPPVVHKIENPVIIPYESEDGPVLALSKGDGVEIDAMIGEFSHLMAEIKEGKPLRLVGQALMMLPAAIAIEPGDDALSDLIGQTIAAMKADGTLRELSVKWFHFDLTMN